MSSVLVTGGAGYIGSHIVRALRVAGRNAVVLDNLIAGHRAAVEGAPLIEADVRETALVRAALRDHEVTAVIHCAGLLSVGESMLDPSRYYDCNVRGSLSLLDAMMAEGIQRLVFSSTCAVYGEPVSTPIDEAHPTNPINPYGETKLAVERALRHYGRAHGLRSIALRYFNAAGADAKGDLGEAHAPELHLIPRAIAAARDANPLRVFGDDYPTSDGTCERDYIHVSDLADAHVRALDALDDEVTARVYNLGTGRPHSVREVIQAVERISGQSVDTTVVSRRPGDPAVLYASAERIATDLGWRPAFTCLDDVVATAWRWHTTHPKGFENSQEPSERG